MPLFHGPAVRLALLCVAAFSAAPALPAWGADPPLIPREVFFGNPDRAGVQISPDGRFLSYLAPSNGVLNIWVQTVGQDDARPVTKATTRPIRVYFWAQNSHQVVFQQDQEGQAGSENYHLYAADLQTGAEIDLTPFPNVQARLTAADRDFPDEILVAINNRDPQLHDVWRINTVTGEGRMVFQNDGGYAELIADSAFNVRLATKYNNRTGGVLAVTRDSPDSPWYELVQWDLDDAATSGPLGFSRDGRTIYLIDSRDMNTGRLYACRINPDDEAPTVSLLAANDRADLNDVVFDPATGTPQAAAFEYTRREWRIIDPSIQAEWDLLTGIARGEMSILSRDRADSKWIVSFAPDNGPESYYLYDRPARSARFLFSSRSQLKGLALAEMKPVVIESRDGLNLVSYLTTPPGQDGKKLPMVLLVHGGPWARDSWGFNRLHQWLANRGYAVLSVNFRGSTGFGKAFLNAGNREWAGRMHNDLIDAVNWAVSQKIADPARIAIMGGSYGGYATLVGLTFTPDFFACGVDIVGPSHVRTLLETIPAYWIPIKSLFEKRVGALAEAEWLDHISPLMKVDAIKRPLLIGQGQNDPRVKEAESRQIVDAMEAKHLPVTYVLFPDEGHGFARPANNLAFFAITEAFLAKQIGGQFEPIGSAVRNSSAQVKAGAALIPGLAEDAGN